MRPKNIQKRDQKGNQNVGRERLKKRREYIWLEIPKKGREAQRIVGES